MDTQGSLALTEVRTQLSSCKKQEQWEKITQIIESFLSNHLDITSQEKMPLIKELCSSYYRLGLYTETIQSANKLYNMGDDNDPNIKATALYFMSAGYRGLKEPEQARDHITTALNMIEQNIEQAIKAKIYFNAGALEQDLCQNYDTAIHYYTQANALLDSTEDHNRTNIRLAHSKALCGELGEANQLLSQIDVEYGNRTHIQFLITSAEIKGIEKEYDIALDNIQKALEMARKKQMITEVERLEKLREEFLSIAKK